MGVGLDLVARVHDPLEAVAVGVGHGGGRVVGRVVAVLEHGRVHRRGRVLGILGVLGVVVGGDGGRRRPRAQRRRRDHVGRRRRRALGRRRRRLQFALRPARRQEVAQLRFVPANQRIPFSCVSGVGKCEQLGWRETSMTACGKIF